MLTDQTFTPSPIIGVGLELFFADFTNPPYQPRWGVLSKFRTHIQNPGFFKFALVHEELPHWKTLHRIVEDIGIKIHFIQFFPKGTPPALVQSMVNVMDVVCSPTVTKLATIPNDKIWPYSTDALVAALVHFNKSCESYSPDLLKMAGSRYTV